MLIFLSSQSPFGRFAAAADTFWSSCSSIRQLSLGMLFGATDYWVLLKTRFFICSTPVQEFLCFDSIYMEYLCKWAHKKSLPTTISLSDDYLYRNRTQNYIQKESMANWNPNSCSIVILLVRLSEWSLKNQLFLWGSLTFHKIIT